MQVELPWSGVWGAGRAQPGALQVSPWCHLLTAAPTPATVRIICVLVASQDSSGTVTELQLPQLLWVLGVWAVLAQGRGGSRGDGGGTWEGQLRDQTLPFCCATAQYELRNLTQHEPAGRAQVVGVPVDTGDLGRLGWWQLLPGDGALRVWKGPAQPRGAVARRGCSVSVLFPALSSRVCQFIPGFSTLRDLCSRSILAVSNQNSSWLF